MSFPPGHTPQSPGPAGPSPYAASLAKSMTITEMRDLHRKVTAEAHAKQTELKLVLASRYRELVGSSDEVLHMQARSRQLDGLVKALPGLAKTLADCAEQLPGGCASSDEEKQSEDSESQAALVSSEGRGQTDINTVRRSLTSLPRSIHRRLDALDVHGASSELVELFGLIAARTRDYPLATALASNANKISTARLEADPVLVSQMKMVYLYVQTVPDRTVRLARSLLHRAAGSHPSGSAAGARMTASAISALDLLDPDSPKLSDDRRAAQLLDLYYESKGRLIQELLDRLGGDGRSGGLPNQPGDSTAAVSTSDEAADDILGRIVVILQLDVMLHPYLIFVHRRFRHPENREEDDRGGVCREEEAIMSTLPEFDERTLRIKASNFLATYLPLIRNKAKAVLMNIAGTTAARLGNIRQSLYDKTDGVECLQTLDTIGHRSWHDAVNAIVDFRTVSAHGTQLFSPEKNGKHSTLRSSKQRLQDEGSSGRRFSLWSALFSTTFSSLVHSILTSSFQSVHTRVIGSLQASLAAAPPLRSILPHEAHRNALRIATDLDLALRKVSDDAHELLVHTEEREESERRLHQSLYVQTCEIMGRLLNELRRMIDGNKNKMANDDEEEATKELIVGRLCHLLKFRLSCLPTLLDPMSSPAATPVPGGHKTGTISLAELRSSFEIADDDEDGLITVEEAEEAAESAFSGTTFRGAVLVKETLLLSSSSTTADNVEADLAASPQNVTLSELVLLSARGLSHSDSGPESALGTIQRSLDDIVEACFNKWARVILEPFLMEFRTCLEREVLSARASDMEWRRLHNLLQDGEEESVWNAKIAEDLPDMNRPPSVLVGDVSPHVTAYLLSVAGALNQYTCPSDALSPIRSFDDALHNDAIASTFDGIPLMLQILRGSLVEESVTSLSAAIESVIGNGSSKEEMLDLTACSTSALIQLQLDLTFIIHCFFERNRNGFAVFARASTNDGPKGAHDVLEKLTADMSTYFDPSVVTNPVALREKMTEMHSQTLRSCNLFLSSLFGDDGSSSYNTSSLAGASSVGALGSPDGASLTTPVLLFPLASSRRFELLPIQAEPSLAGLRLQGNYAKEKEVTAETESASGAASAMTSGFGFFSAKIKSLAG